MSEIAIITAADSRYYPLMCEAIASFRAHAPEGTQICVINAGLREDEKEKLKAQGIVVEDGIWPVKLNPKKIKSKEFLKACVSRPFIPELFPGHDVYVWLDADTWLQDGRALELLIEGARRNALAIAPQVDRAYGRAMRLEWLGPFPWKARSFYYSNARRAFSSKVARQLFPYPTLNAGVFALSGKAPHWARWQTLIKKALKRGKVFTAEQLTLGMMVYLEEYKAEFLPAWCNWLCETKPKWDESRKMFVEPYLPHTPISVMHLSGYDKMRVDPSLTTEIKTVSGGMHTMSLRYQDA